MLKNVEDEELAQLLKNPCQHSHSTLYLMDVQRMSFWDIAIIIKYPEWSQLSNGYPGDVQVSTQVCEILRYGSEKYVIVPLLHNEN